MDEEIHWSEIIYINKRQCLCITFIFGGTCNGRELKMSSQKSRTRNEIQIQSNADQRYGTNPKVHPCTLTPTHLHLSMHTCACMHVLSGFPLLEGSLEAFSFSKKCFHYVNFTTLDNIDQDSINNKDYACRVFWAVHLRALVSFHIISVQILLLNRLISKHPQHFHWKGFFLP